MYCLSLIQEQILSVFTGKTHSLLDLTFTKYLINWLIWSIGSIRLLNRMTLLILSSIWYIWLKYMFSPKCWATSIKLWTKVVPKSILFRKIWNVFQYLRKHQQPINLVTSWSRYRHLNFGEFSILESTSINQLAVPDWPYWELGRFPKGILDFCMRLFTNLLHIGSEGLFRASPALSTRIKSIPYTFYQGVE